MRNYFKFCILIISFLSITSCFEIIEEIDLKSDGTGTMTYTLNLSKSKSKLASIMLLDSINGYKVPSRADIQKGLEDIVSELNKAEASLISRKLPIMIILCFQYNVTLIRCKTLIRFLIRFLVIKKIKL